MGGAGGPAVGVDPRELEDVEALVDRGEVMAPLTGNQFDARILDPRPEVVCEGARHDLDRRGVDLDRSNAGRFEKQRREDVEATPDADHGYLGAGNGACMVGGRVERLLDFRQRCAVAVVLDSVGKGVVVLGEHPPKALMECAIAAEQ